mmetsp:Transcript_27652/g.34344  ORF Transcript_27652/g.34344 Transcript_27652/m.34344 type:complete len:83 (+) Transcript_27652:347-595(+)
MKKALSKMMKQESHLNRSERSDVDFKLEMQCLHLHELKNMREEIRQIIWKIYVNKCNVKCYSPYLYSGEQRAGSDYFNLRYF